MSTGRTSGPPPGWNRRGFGPPGSPPGYRGHPTRRQPDHRQPTQGQANPWQTSPWQANRARSPAPYGRPPGPFVPQHPMGPPRPVRRGSSGCLTGLVVTGVVLVVGFMALVLVVGTFLDAAEEAGDQTYPDPYPTSRTTREPRDPSTEEPTEEPTREPTKTPKKKEKPPHLRKQQGREEIPLPDQPASLDEAKDIIQRSDFYLERASTRKCSGLPNDGKYPYGNVSNKTWKRVAQKQLDCARNVWAKPLAEAGFQATRVRVTIFSGSVDSPCGTGDAPAFYCSANQGVYLNIDGGGADPNVYTWAWHLMTLAHEYGHHVQARTGILAASYAWQYSQESDDGYWRVSRRMELQANCLGGTMLRRSGSVSEANFVRNASSMYGEKEHGSRKNQYRWYWQGWQNNETRQCNTYTVAGKYVS